jgi:hypothetical protein
MRTIIALALLAALTTSTPAFDDLLLMAPAIPTDPDLPVAFDYTAPRDGFAPDSPAYGPGDHALAAALLRGGIDQMTGVNFGSVDGVLTMGTPPGVVTVLFGPEGFAGGTASALLDRGFTEAIVEGFPTYSKGDDYAVDIAAARDPDPFASGLGRSQRVALGDDFLLVTAGTDELTRSLAALYAIPGIDDFWTPTFKGLQAAAGAESHLFIASGWNGTAFIDPGLPSLTTGKTKSKAPPPRDNVIFPVAVFAATQTDASASVHIAMPFGSAEEAERGSSMIAERVLDEGFGPVSSTVETLDGFVAIGIVTIEVRDAKAARDLYASWMALINQRQFTPLAIAF